MAAGWPPLILHTCEATSRCLARGSLQGPAHSQVCHGYREDGLPGGLRVLTYVPQSSAGIQQKGACTALDKSSKRQLQFKRKYAEGRNTDTHTHPVHLRRPCSHTHTQ